MNLSKEEQIALFQNPEAIEGEDFEMDETSSSSSSSSSSSDSDAAPS